MMSPTVTNLARGVGDDRRLAGGPYTLYSVAVRAYLVPEGFPAPSPLEVLVLFGLVLLRPARDALLDDRLETPDQAL